MELTPQTLRDVEFREKLRGYHPDDVDDFLEEVAVAVDSLLGRLRAAEAAAGGSVQAAAPPAPAPVASAPAVAPSGDSTLSEGTLSRAILLAQRTADIAVAEAEESARQILDEARAEADRILADTQSKVAAMTEEARTSAEASVSELEQRRAALEREVTSLQSWAAKHRDSLRDVLSDQLRSLDVWLTTATVPRPPARAAQRPSMPSGEPTAAMPVVEPSSPAEHAAKPADATAEPAGDAAADDGADARARRRAVPDSPAAAVSEAVEAGALAGPGGGGDGVTLFDQESEDTGAPLTGARFRRR
ncbi:MAG TPA: DivIVA domain-containing protein [Acidimicrobiales bacterium]|nr:DivIVA domain-containing protein [Acidimicrobiales bacterium]